MQHAQAEQQRLIQERLLQERDKNEESVLREAAAREAALKELHDDPQYEEQKTFWPRAEAHFNYFDVFEKIIDERTARQKAQSQYVSQNTEEDDLEKLMKIANGEQMDDEEEKFMLYRIKK